MERITPQPTSHDAQQALKWLCEGDNHALDESGLNDIARLLIAKINQLGSEVEYLRNRVNQLDILIGY